MTCDVKGNILCYSCYISPLLEYTVYRSLMRKKKNKIAIISFTSLWQQFQCFIRDRKTERFFHFLHLYLNPIPFSAFLQITPFQFSHVAHSQSTQTTKQKSLFHYLILTFHIYQELQFINS